MSTFIPTKSDHFQIGPRTECVLDKDAGRLTLKLDFVAGSKFAAPGAGHQLLFHYTVERKWRHLDFFQYEVLARALRVKPPEGDVIQVEVPGRDRAAGSRF